MSFGKRVRTTEINNKTFQIHVLLAGDGIVMAQKLSQLVAPFFTGSDEVEIDFIKIATSISSSLGEGDMLNMIKKLLKDLAVDGQAVQFDDYFSCNYGELISIVAFALKENFSSFFEGLGILEE